MKSFETVLAEQCAPTLAGIKPASLFRWIGRGSAELARWRGTLAAYGMEVRLLNACGAGGNCLVYLFRRERLHRIFSDGAVRSFLVSLGYPDGDWDEILTCLSRRFRPAEAFPHEIGVFLGYPLEDVAGFMKYGGRNYTYCGCWKVYGNPEEAKRRFAAYHRCTAFYCERVRAGVPLTDLLAAA